MLHPGADVLVVEEHGTVYLIPPLRPVVRLNQTASYLWRILSQGNTVASAISRYCAEYGCDESTGADETLSFVRAMIVDGLLSTMRMCEERQ